MLFIKRILSLLLVVLFAFSLTPMVLASSEAQTTELSEEQEDYIDIFVWAEDIPTGTRIFENHLKKIRIQRENAPLNVITDPEKIYTSYAKRDLFADEYVSVDQISSQKVNKVNKDVLIKPIDRSNGDYLIVTDYLVPNTGEDLATLLQEIIDKNPNRTIYFPDGEYVISQPLLTSAVSRESVSIQLSDGAVIKASYNWHNRGGNAMICLGGGGDKNDIVSLGSYYIVSGGTLDGNNRANCISIDSGRESVIKNICLKNPQKGIVIKEGVNGNSSDIDMEDITIIGSGMPGTVGIDSIGCDNTYTNIRVYDMEKGLVNAVGDVTSVYVFNTEKSAKLNTVGITGAWRMANCVTVNCDVGYVLNEGTITFDCVSVWTSAEHTSQTMFNANGKKVMVSGSRAYFFEGDNVNCNFITNYPEGKEPIVEGCFYE